MWAWKLSRLASLPLSQLPTTIADVLLATSQHRPFFEPYTHRQPFLTPCFSINHMTALGKYNRGFFLHSPEEGNWTPKDNQLPLKAHRRWPTQSPLLVQS